MMKRLGGRTALVTGAGRGIGRAISLRLAEEGARVAVVTRTAAAGAETVDSIRAAGGEAELFVADVSGASAARAVVEEVGRAFHGLDALVHNAALVTPAPIGTLDDDAIEDGMALNLKSAFWLIGAALPLLRSSLAARFIAVSSITGNRIANEGFAVYGATKAGLNGFIRQAAAELGPVGIRVNGIEPGVTLTTSVADYLGESSEAIARDLPLRRVTRPQDVAAAVAFLASDDGAQITGQTIIVDGGQSLGASPIGRDRE